MSLSKGKLSLAELNRLVFPHLPRVEDDRKVSLDYVTTQVNGNLVVASDPVIGVPLQYYGFFAVHYSATDVAMAGATPQYLTLGIYYPPETNENWLIDTVTDLGKEAELLNLKILGGHTGGYDGLQTPLITSTCFGILPEKYEHPPQIKAGNVLIAVGPLARETLWFLANVEPSNVDAIVSRSRREKIAIDLSPFSVAALVNTLPKEDILLMHDLAEGGLATGLNELQTATGFGIHIQYNSIPWDEVAISLFDYLGWNPLHCSSFGSFLIITSPEAADPLIQSIRNSAREAAIIGTFTKKKKIIVEYPHETKRLKSGKDPYQRFTSKLSGMNRIGYK